MKNKKIEENFLDKIPVKSEIKWEKSEDGSVTLHVENKGAMNKIAQLVFKKPKVSFIHLDEMGNFVWPLIDGEKTVYEIGVLVKEHFGEKAEPLYERLSQYFKTLEAYKFIIIK